MDQAAQECARGQHNCLGANALPIEQHHTGDPSIPDQQIVHLPLDHIEIGLCHNGALHGLTIELAVGLCPWATNGRALAAVEHPELNPGRVGDMAHQPAQGVDLPHQMPFAQATNRRVAAHFANCGKAMRDERRGNAEPRGSGRGLAAGMPAPYDDDRIIRHGAPLVPLPRDNGCFT